MLGNHPFARQVRLRRLFGKGNQRIFIVPMDHPITDGPITVGAKLDQLVGELAHAGADAVVLHKGNLRRISCHWFTDISLIVHLSASTVRAPDPDAKYLVATAEECLRIGADAVSVHVNLGSPDEARQIADFAAVSEACDRWNLPLLAMVYPRGPGIDNPRDPALVAHAATLAAELGADVVKTPYAGSVPEMRDVIRACPIPLIVAGGPRQDDIERLLSFVNESMRAGAAGVAIGRSVFQAPKPGVVARQIAARVHDGTELRTLPGARTAAS